MDTFIYNSNCIVYHWIYNDSSILNSIPKKTKINVGKLYFYNLESI